MQTENSQSVNAFTYGFNHRMNVLYCPVGVSAAISTVSNAKHRDYRAIWDTGASGSVITRKCAQDLGLLPTGITKVYNAGGEDICNIYTVDILLPNKIRMVNVNVTEGKLTGFDILIGMDIIGSGDFAVSTNKDGHTFISYRIPTSGKIVDFAEQENKKHQRKGSQAKIKQNKRKQERQKRKRSRK